MINSVRIDRWLWAARFFKTRSLAKSAIEGGKVRLEGQRTKPAKEIHQGQRVTIRRGDELFEVAVVELSERRGPASIAQTLYLESEQSIEQRQTLSAKRKMERAGLRVPDTKPSKKQRRDLRRLKATPQRD